PTRGGKDVVLAVREYSEKPSVAIELSLKAGGHEALQTLESMVGSYEGKMQFAAATLLFKLADAATRDRVLAVYQQRKEPNGTWTLSEPGTDDEDSELVPIA